MKWPHCLRVYYPVYSGMSGLVPNLQISIVGYRCGTPARMSAEGRMPPASYRSKNACLRRNLVVPARSGEGLLTILIADLRHRAVQPGGLLDAPPLSRNKARSAESNSDQSQQILLGACRA